MTKGFILSHGLSDRPLVVRRGAAGEWDSCLHLQPESRALHASAQLPSSFFLLYSAGDSRSQDCPPIQEGYSFSVLTYTCRCGSESSQIDNEDEP